MSVVRWLVLQSLALSLAVVATAGDSSPITKKELEAVHTNVHSHCRTIDTHEYNNLREYACVNKPNMEWHERQEEEYNENFETAAHQRKRRLVAEQTDAESSLRNPWYGKAFHMARFSTDTIFSHENIQAWEQLLDNEVRLDEVFRPNSYDGLNPDLNAKRNNYIRFYSNDKVAQEVQSKLANVEAITILPDSWKISPLFHGSAHLKSSDPERQPNADGAEDTVNMLIRIVHPTKSSTQSGFEADDILKMLERWEKALLEEKIRFSGLHAATNDRHDPLEDLMVLTDVPESQVRKTKFKLSTFNEVKWIEPEMVHYTSNKFSRYVTQSYTEPGTSGKTSIWDKGLHGEGQVVGIGDSGLDIGSCFFNDPNNAYGPIAKGVTQEKPNHRKVTQYVPFADGGPGNGNPGENLDHGTHVAGSVAGKSRQSAGSVYDGMAYEAKIAFFDIGETGARGLSVPRSMERNFFPPAYTAGARIHTNSWGSNTDAYTATARSVDTFTFQNQDFVVLVAAGNSGSTRQGTTARQTVGSPASSKNCVAVGASQSTSQSFQEANSQCDTGNQGLCQDNMARFSSVGLISSDSRLKPDIAAPGHRTWSALSSPGQGGTVCQAGNADPSSTVAAISGTSMATPTTAGNMALIRQYFTEGYYPLGVKTAANAFEPMGALLKAAIVNSGKFMGGTHGNTNTQLCAGKDATTGICGKNTEDGAQMRASPSYVERSVQGHGLTVLDRTLSFANEAEADKTDLLAIGDMANMKSLKTGEEDTYEINTIETTPPVPLRITLAWNDAPGANGATKALVNNLDLIVTDQNGKRYVPNGLQTLETDDINPLENVEVNVPGAQTITVKVRGQSITQPFAATGGQPYSLVVSGRFRKTGDLIGGGAAGAPVVIPKNTPYIDGKKNKLIIVGANPSLSGSRRRRSLLQQSDVAVEFECADGTPPEATVQEATSDAIIVVTNEGWSCPTKMDVRKVINGVESPTVEFGKASSGNFVTNPDGTVTAIPADEDKDSTCLTFTLENTCKNVPFCEWNASTKTCSGKSTAWVAVVVILIVIVVLILCYCGYKKYTQERDKPRGNIKYSERNAQNVEIRYLEKNMTGVAVGISPASDSKSKGGNAANLPPNWEAIKDDESGDYYYYNKKTGETCWELPNGQQSVAKTPKRTAKTPRGFRGKSMDFSSENAKSNLPSDWKAVVDTDSGDTFYYNSKTGKTQWEKPEVEKAAPSRTAKTPRGFRANSGFQADSNKIPEPWEAVVDVDSGDTYYYNRKTQEVTWDLPN